VSLLAASQQDSILCRVPQRFVLGASLQPDMVDIIACAIFGDCWLRGVSLVRGVIFPSLADLRYCPYNTGLVTYFLPPALERIKNTYCMGQRPFLYLYCTARVVLSLFSN